MNYRERYKTAPMGGEFSFYTQEDQANVLNREGMHGRIFESEAAKFHLSYITQVSHLSKYLKMRNNFQKKWWIYEINC
jgi:hypothetical protein